MSTRRRTLNAPGGQTRGPGATNRRTSRKEPTAAAAKRQNDEDDTTRRSDRHRVKTADSSALGFDYYLTEGKTYSNTGDYNRAVTGYSKALEQKPDHKGCLLSRSQCFLQLGDTRSALADADCVLSDSKTDIKGTQQKADVLYQMGEFEQALVLYHRGHKLRPDIDAFRLGIQLCQGAIENCIGEKAGIHLDKTGDLSFFIQQQQQKDGKRPRAGIERETSRLPQEKPKRRRDVNRSCREEKTMKMMLEQLYADKQYLEQLIAESERVNASSKTSDEIIKLSSSTLDYLDTRAEFWQQKEPTYSRDRNRAMQEANRSKTSSPDSGVDATSWVLDNLRIIDDDQAAGKYSTSLERATRVLKRVEQMSVNELSQKLELEAHLHSYSGNAHLELGQLDDAMKHHQLDLDIARRHNLPEAASRATDNIGRVLVRQQKYRDAIKLFKQRMSSTKHALEQTWLYHEIGRCYLELNDYKQSLQFADMSQSAARQAEDQTWQLNATVLQAQSHLKLHQYNEAVDSFECALDLAQCASDDHAVSVIQKALADVKQQQQQHLPETESPDNNVQQKQEVEQVDGAVTSRDNNDTQSRDDDKQSDGSPDADDDVGPTATESAGVDQ